MLHNIADRGKIVREETSQEAGRGKVKSFHVIEQVSTSSRPGKKKHADNITINYYTIKFL